MKKLYSAIGCVCILAAILCMLCIDTDVDFYNNIKYEEYGGDAYTGIQNAAAATVANINNTNRILGQLLEAIRMISSLSFLVVGCFAFAKAAKLQIEENLAKVTNKNNNLKSFELHNNPSFSYDCRSFDKTGSKMYGKCEICGHDNIILEYCTVTTNTEEKGWSMCQECQDKFKEKSNQDNNRSTSNSRIRCPFCGYFHDWNCKECPNCGHKY